MERMRRVLIVEDNDDIRAMLDHIVRRRGECSPTAVATATEARACLHDHDVLCTDLNLGGPVDGLKLAKAFKEARPWGQVIVITGSEVPHSPYVDQVLRKPTTPEDVHKATALAALRQDLTVLSLFDRAVEAMKAAEAAVERTRSLLSETVLPWGHELA